MTTKRPSTNKKSGNQLTEALRDRQLRLQGYRERALKLYPWVCAKCGREFPGRKMGELTVHHKDHNHDNNPPDGSNWELLCIYCHDNEHSRGLEAEWQTGPAERDDTPVAASHNPFAGLNELLNNKK